MAAGLFLESWPNNPTLIKHAQPLIRTCREHGVRLRLALMARWLMRHREGVPVESIAAEVDASTSEVEQWLAEADAIERFPK